MPAARTRPLLPHGLRPDGQRGPLLQGPGRRLTRGRGGCLPCGLSGLLPAGLRGALATWALAMALAPAAAQAGEPAAGELQLAWLDTDGQLHTATLGPDGQPRAQPARPLQPGAQVPLGSLWKLVAYAQLQDSGAQEAPYTCRGQDPEEAYCCTGGSRIDRGTALWKSCGLYFAPARLHWAGQTPGATLQALPASLATLREAAHLDPATTVPLADWLQWLARWPTATREAAQADLAAYWLQGPGQRALGAVGSRLRLKTFTLARREPGGAGMRWSGASGWTREGTPLWLATLGSSARSVPEWAPRVLAFLDAQRAAGAELPAPLLDGPCVQARLFARYPIAAIRPRPEAGGVLPAGRYRLQFQSGQALDIQSQRDLLWHPAVSGSADAGHLDARLTLEDYVARVVDREGSAEPAAAAQALAVAARSYLLARATAQGPCLQVDDSSAFQRVAPRPPTAGAQAAAALTAGLVLHGGPGTPGRFHGDTPQRNVMAWRQVAQQARTHPQGFDQLLRQAYPDFGLALAGQRDERAPTASSCEPLPLAAQWLNEQAPRWRRSLQGQAGYSTPASVQVCRLQQGLPHALRGEGRVYARGLQSLEDRLSLTHEYLHLAFSGHPHGVDEAFIEQQARHLLGVD